MSNRVRTEEQLAHKREMARARYAGNTELQRALRESWAREHPRKRVPADVQKAKRLARDRAYAASHREEAKTKSRAWYSANKERARERANAYRLTHPEETKQRQNRWNEAHREQVRSYDRKAKYGLDRAAYASMQISQDGRCAICLQKRKLVVDHDHATGKVRALLCVNCNCMIGHAKESEARLRAGIRYLRAHGATETQPEALPLFSQVKA